MEVIPTELAGVLRLRPKVFKDERGQFQETFNQAGFARATGITHPFVQMNESISHRGVVRGLHLQVAPSAQAKLVRVASGAVQDVCVDLRPDSATFGKHISVHLDDKNGELLYIPAGLAHGFAALAERTIFSYLCSHYYDPQAERTVLWNDPALGIIWEVEDPQISEKDRQGHPFAQRSWEP